MGTGRTYCALAVRVTGIVVIPTRRMKNVGTDVETATSSWRPLEASCCGVTVAPPPSV